MECNKDEALRAKEISEAKLIEKDFVGAKKIAQKADKLFPGLEGLSHLFQILDVYISSEKKVNGVSDWYSVLGVDPTADDEAIRRSYRKLALSLHPDKNKSIGAEGAFKLVSEAWTILADKGKKKAYDQKRNPKPIYQKVSTSTPPPTTFWTSCTKCKMHFEYLKVYLNQKILCTNCHEPFWALAISPPPVNLHQMWHPPQNKNLNANHQMNNLGGQFKRQHEVGYQSPNSVKLDGIAKKRRVAEQSTMEREKVNLSTVNKPKNSVRELSSAELRTILVSKARNEINKKLDEWNAENEKEKEKEKEIKKEVIKKQEIVPNGMSKVKDVKTPSKDSLDDMDDDVDDDDDMDTDTKNTEAILMSVPDPDFHDFDMDRSERAFSENQVWAAYDEDDGMPRYYAMIHSVISRKPFKMEISWLNSKSNAELAPINWVASGFPKTSGDFRIGKREINTSLNSFSHKVHWEKGKKGIIQIYPRKHEVWAVYKNWCPDWNEFTPDEAIHKYDMVVVLEDYEEGKGIMVNPLVKVGGFKSVFHQQHSDVKETRMIPKEEIFRLSHKVPYYLLTGEEGSNVPKGCLELDPAALPLELLKSTVEEKVNPVEVKGIITYARKRGKNAKIGTIEGVVLENDVS
uniref:J domain-containing protein n=1 Tax=Lactuca sativa TaxID=4236 RepID=A0A9R1VCG0_LACSA|nr:hypothetical protein LSAT_V11C500233560 [Lactuca sativa]